MTAPGVYSPEQAAAHAHRVARDEDDTEARAVEAMARAMRPILEGDNEIYWASEYGRPTPQASLDALATAALDALRGMGE